MTGRFATALAGADVPVVAEVKVRSAEGADLLRGRGLDEIVDAYHEAGAACLSVVTGRWFGGTTELLERVAARTHLPILQKDFLTRDAQLRKAADLGASAVLLTAGLLSRSSLAALTDKALDAGLTPFIEVVDTAEAAAVVRGAECVVAVNNKDIRTGERGGGDTGRSLGMLGPVLATGTACPVSASGIDSPAAAVRLVRAGYTGLLVATALLSAGSPVDWFAEYRAERETAERIVEHGMRGSG